MPSEVPSELLQALARNTDARNFFNALAPSYRKHFVMWFAAAKGEETKARRLNECLTLLSKGEKLGLK